MFAGLSQPHYSAITAHSQWVWQSAANGFLLLSSSSGSLVGNMWRTLLFFHDNSSMFFWLYWYFPKMLLLTLHLTFKVCCFCALYLCRCHKIMSAGKLSTIYVGRYWTLISILLFAMIMVFIAPKRTLIYEKYHFVKVFLCSWFPWRI